MRTGTRSTRFSSKEGQRAPGGCSVFEIVILGGKLDLGEQRSVVRRRQGHGKCASAERWLRVCCQRVSVSVAAYEKHGDGMASSLVLYVCIRTEHFQDLDGASQRSSTPPRSMA
eukprot:3837492-Lingulodinium_polyedra.AAC.1